MDFKDKHRELLYEACKMTMDFLSSNSLRFWGAYGTILGAVRHGDIIPWDDDIDLFMPRADFNKLIALRDSLPQGYTLAAPGDSEYPFQFIKIYNNKTTLWEYEQYNYVQGVFVDIFPLDSFNSAQVDIVKTLERTGWLARHISAFMAHHSLAAHRRILQYQGLREWLYVLREYYLMRPMKRRYKKELMALLAQSCAEQEADTYLMAVGKTPALKKEWFDRTVQMPVGQLQMPIPAGYDAFLRALYGDYMQLPSEEKRNSGHVSEYVNLKERLPLSEIRQRIEKGERVVY